MNIINRSSIRKNVPPTVWGRVESQDNGLLGGTRRRVVETDISVSKLAGSCQIIAAKASALCAAACRAIAELLFGRNGARKRKAQAAMNPEFSACTTRGTSGCRDKRAEQNISSKPLTPHP